MKAVFQNIIFIAAMILLLAGILITYNTAWEKFSSVSHPGVVIQMHPGEKQYVTKAEVSRIVAGIPRSDTVTLTQYVQHLEREVERHPLVENAEVWFTPGGKLYVDILQITPVALVNTGNTQRYLDRRGKLLPVSHTQREALPVVSGPLSDKDVVEMFPMLRYVYNQPQLANQVRSVEFDGRQLRLRLRTLSSPVIFGDTTDYRWKFYKLLKIQKYLSGRPSGNPYIRINLKYADQIVCIRNN